MPVITIEGSKITKEQKKNIINDVTEVLSKNYKIPTQSFTVIIHENDSENIGVSGKQLSELIHK
ncbi:MAG: tautomerase family protein [Methanobacteriaceae archaeon]|nr:tautomerase family protein [Methanobacteriaceae archaeon]